MGSITILDVLYVMGIVDVLAKLKTADSILEKESTKQEEGRKKKKNLLKRLKRLLLILKKHLKHRLMRRPQLGL